MSTVTFNASNGTSLTVLLAETSPKVSDGYAKWNVIDRPRRKGITQYNGRNPVVQPIAVMFDGWSSDESQEDDIALLESMAEATDLGEPPKITLSGHAVRKDLTWVISNITWDDANTIWIKNGNDPVRVRLSGVVELTEFVADDVLSTATSPNPNPKNKKVRVKVKTGMSLKQLAQLYYQDPDKYWIILQANPFLNPDPRAIIPAGTSIWIPSLTVAPGQEITVP